MDFVLGDGIIGYLFLMMLFCISPFSTMNVYNFIIVKEIQ